MGDAAASRSRMLVRALLGPATTVDESRGYLQARLLMFTRLMFAAFCVLIVFIAATYWKYPEIKPALNSYIVAGEVFALVAMAVVWKGFLARGPLSVEALYRIDGVYAVGIGTAFGASALFAPELPPAAWTSLIFSCFSAFTRALVVPSSGRRTALVSALGFVPLEVAAIGLAMSAREDLPPPAFAVGCALMAVLVVVIAANGSRIIYGLNRQVTEAMQLGAYTLETRIGAGGMGEVWRGRHARLLRPTAIKLLRPERVGGADALDRFESEVQAMSKLTHPNTVAVFDYGRNLEGVFYYAMEYLGDGVNLGELVRTYRAQPPDRVTHILIQVCGALQEAHDAGMVHRDIKPENIIVCERGGLPDFAKVVDYGLVKDLNADVDASTQIILGTAHYMAPERNTDPAAVGPAVDLYALGCVGYFLLTGRHVFEGKTPVDVCVQHITATPRPVSDFVAVPPALEAILLQCLAKTPAGRPASAAALAAALRAVPSTPGWDEAEAKRWWREVHVAVAAREQAAARETITMGVAPAPPRR